MIRDPVSHWGQLTQTRCLIPWIDGVVRSREWMEALSDKFIMGPRSPVDRQGIGKMPERGARCPSTSSAIAGDGRGYEHRSYRAAFDGSDTGGGSSDATEVLAVVCLDANLIQIPPPFWNVGRRSRHHRPLVHARLSRFQSDGQRSDRRPLTRSRPVHRIAADAPTAPDRSRLRFS